MGRRRGSSGKWVTAPKRDLISKKVADDIEKKFGKNFRNYMKMDIFKRVELQKKYNVDGGVIFSFYNKRLSFYNRMSLKQLQEL